MTITSIPLNLLTKLINILVESKRFLSKVKLACQENIENGNANIALWLMQFVNTNGISINIAEETMLSINIIDGIYDMRVEFIDCNISQTLNTLRDISDKIGIMLRANEQLECDVSINNDTLFLISKIIDNYSLMILRLIQVSKFLIELMFNMETLYFHTDRELTESQFKMDLDVSIRVIENSHTVQELCNNIVSTVNSIIPYKLNTICIIWNLDNILDTVARLTLPPLIETAVIRDCESLIRIVHSTTDIID